MHKPKVLLTEEVGYGIIDRLSSHFELTVGSRGQFDVEEGIINSIDPETEGILSMLSNPFSAKVLDACPNLKIITNNAVGYNNIDTEACKVKGIIVTNTPDVLTNATADGAMALLLATVRNIVASDAYLRMGKFDGWHPTVFCGLELNNAKLGIFGMGRIGQAIAKRAQAFGMQIYYTNRKPIDPSLESALQATYIPSIAQLAEEVDVLMLSSPLSPETHHAVNSSILDALGPNSYLINISRGPVVDEKALVEALKSEKIAGAGLDVFEEEPRIQPYLMKSDRCTLTPHIASATHYTRKRMLEMGLNALVTMLVNKTPKEIAHRVA